jgi:hypothetical protein
MTNEGPVKKHYIQEEINSESKAGQEKLVREIDDDIYSEFLSRKLDGIKRIPQVINPIIRNNFEVTAFRTIKHILKNANSESVSSINSTLEAIKCINSLNGSLRNEALQLASIAYESFNRRYREMVSMNIDLQESSLGRFFKEADLIMSSLVEDIPISTKTEDYSHISNKEKLEWALYLLRGKTWPEIADGVKIFAQIKEKITSETPEFLIERIEEKIKNLIILGLNCNELERGALNNNNPKVIQAKTVLMTPPLLENAIYANLMAVDLIKYASPKFKKELIEIAKKNIHISEEISAGLEELT